MPMRKLTYLTCLALPFVAVCAGSVSAQTVEGEGSSKVMMFDRPPTVDELRGVVAPAEPKMRTRSIEIIGGAAASAGNRARPTEQTSYGAPPPSPPPQYAEPAAQRPPQPAPRRAPEAVAPQEAAVPAASAPAETQASQQPGAFGFRINFAFNSAEIPREFYAYIDSVGQLMAQDGDLKLMIEGHTDAVGSPSYNKTLSERRAISVGEYLVRVHNIQPQRIAIAGMGPTQPIASNPYDGSNRRVEFKPAR